MKEGSFLKFKIPGRPGPIKPPQKKDPGSEKQDFLSEARQSNRTPPSEICLEATADIRPMHLGC